VNSGRLAEAIAVKEKREQELLRIPGVTGVGVRNAKIMVYVESEEAAAQLPLSVDDIPVVVRVTGPIWALSVAPMSIRAFAASRTSRWRPAPGGVSCGHYGITAGTLGVLVRDATDGEKVILSNNHVLANVNRGVVGDSILQPGKYDGGSEGDRIAGLKRFVEIDPSVGNLVDGAIASPDDQSYVSDDILEVGRLSGWSGANIGMSVSKSGRTTGLTSSTVIDVNATVQVNYGVFTAPFRDQIMIDSPAESFGAGGDSGSLVFSAPYGLPVAVGLLFAGSSNVIVANKISHVIDQLKLNLGSGSPSPPSPPSDWGLVGALSGPIGVLGTIGIEEGTKGGVFV